MNYYKARQLPSGKWHYTCENGGRIHAVGYCSPWEVCKQCNGMAGMYLLDEPCLVCENKGLIPLESPCLGHDTEEAACEHYRQYEIDKATFRKSDETKAQELRRCLVCQQWTSGVAMVGGFGVYDLCDEHCNSESLQTVYPVVGESWSS